MDREEVTKWLTIIKANLNSFPEVSSDKKSEALGEAIRLLKNERSIDKIDCEHTECRNCINHKYCDYEASSSEIPNKSEVGSTTKKCTTCAYREIDGKPHEVCKSCVCGNRYKHYIAVWSIDEELKRGNKNSFHNFIDTDGNKLMIASKLHRVSGETVKKIWELIKAESEGQAN